jgi:hypothetical protein
MLKESLPVIEVPRALARQLRAVLRRIASRGSRCPFVLARAGPEGLLLQAALDEVAVAYHRPGALPSAAIAFSAEALAAFEGPGDDLVALQEVGSGLVQVQATFFLFDDAFLDEVI